MRAFIQLLGFFAAVLGGGITIKSLVTIVIGEGTNLTVQRWAIVGGLLFGAGALLASLPGAAEAVRIICGIGVVQSSCGESPSQKEQEQAIKREIEARSAAAVAAAHKAEAEAKAAKEEADRQAEDAKKRASDLRIQREREAQEAEILRQRVKAEAEELERQRRVDADRRQQEAEAAKAQIAERQRQLQAERDRRAAADRACAAAWADWNNTHEFDKKWGNRRPPNC